MKMTKQLIAVLLLAVPCATFAQRDSIRAREAYLEGMAAMHEKKTSVAIDAFDRATKLDPRSEYFVWLGHAHTRDISTASFIRQPIVARRIRAAYDKAVELDSTNVDAAEARVEYYANAPGIVGGGMDKARAEAARLKKLHSERGDIALGFIEEREGRLDAAEGMYKAAIQAAPDSATRVIGESRLRNLQRKMKTGK